MAQGCRGVRGERCRCCRLRGRRIRSPPEIVRIQSVVGKGLHGGQPVWVSGRPPARSGRRTEWATNPERHRQAIWYHDRTKHPGVRGRSTDPDRRRDAARRKEPRPVGQGLQQAGQLAPPGRRYVKGHHDRVPLGLRQDACLVPAVERHRRQPALLLGRGPGEGRPVGRAGPAGGVARGHAGRRAHGGASQARAERSAQEGPASRRVRRAGGLVRRADVAGFAVACVAVSAAHSCFSTSKMAAIGARTWSDSLAAASICSRCGTLSSLTGVQLPFGCLAARISPCSRSSQTYT